MPDKQANNEAAVTRLAGVITENTRGWILMSTFGEEGEAVRSLDQAENMSLKTKQRPKSKIKQLLILNKRANKVEKLSSRLYTAQK